jgi:hypothetical protein
MDQGDRYAGMALAAASILSVVAMAHHPSGATAHSGLNQFVHGAMIVIVLVSLCGFARLAMRMGIDRFEVLCGLIGYAAAAFANLLAATINGFAAPAAFQHSASQDAMRFAWELNQALAFGGVHGIGAAFLLWGAALIRKGGFERWLGIGALIVGLVTVASVAAGFVRMNVSGAFIVYGLQAAFGVLAGAALMRPRS